MFLKKIINFIFLVLSCFYVILINSQQGKRNPQKQAIGLAQAIEPKKILQNKPEKLKFCVPSLGLKEILPRIMLVDKEGNEFPIQEAVLNQSEYYKKTLKPLLTQARSVVLQRGQILELALSDFSKEQLRIWVDLLNKLYIYSSDQTNTKPIIIDKFINDFENKPEISKNISFLLDKADKWRLPLLHKALENIESEQLVEKNFELNYKQIIESENKFINDTKTLLNGAIVAQESIANTAAFQVGVLHQATAASCGYEALKNGLILYEAFAKNNQQKLKDLINHDLVKKYIGTEEKKGNGEKQ